MSSKAATLSFEFSAVIKKRTASGPRRMVSSEGLTRTLFKLSEALGPKLGAPLAFDVVEYIDHFCVYGESPLIRK